MSTTNEVAASADTRVHPKQTTRSPIAQRSRAFASRNNMWIALALAVGGLSLVSESFRSIANLQNVLAQNGIIGIVAIGMLVMMISGGFDLSVGAVGSAVAVCAAYVSVNVNLPAAVAVGLALGIALGLWNGFVIAKIGINSFIVTFAMASIVTGVILVLTDGRSVVGRSPELQEFAFGRFAGIPMLFCAFLVFAGATHLFLSSTKWGHWIYSAGANSEASYLSGIPVVYVKLAAFTFGGLAVAIGGVLMFGQSAIGQPTGASSWPLSAIAICVIGGTSLNGGVGRVGNVVAAALLLGVVANGLNQLGITPYWQPAVTGAIILAAVLADKFGQAQRHA